MDSSETQQPQQELEQRQQALQQVDRIYTVDAGNGRRLWPYQLALERKHAMLPREIIVGSELSRLRRAADSTGREGSLAAGRLTSVARFLEGRTIEQEEQRRKAEPKDKLAELEERKRELVDKIVNPASDESTGLKERLNELLAIENQLGRESERRGKSSVQADANRPTPDQVARARIEQLSSGPANYVSLQWEKLPIEERLRGASGLVELATILKSAGTIKGSSAEYQGEDFSREIITHVEQGTIASIKPDNFTRTHGIRDAIERCRPPTRS